MSTKDKHISRDQMRQYLEGQLKGKAAHQVERQLLESEFDQEAMEGFDGWDQNLIDDDLMSLRTKIGQAKRRGLFYYAAASVTLLILAAGGIWLFSDQLIKDERLSYQEEKVEEILADSLIIESNENLEEEERSDKKKPELETTPLPKPQKSPAVVKAESAADKPLIAEVIEDEPSASPAKRMQVVELKPYKEDVVQLEVEEPELDQSLQTTNTIQGTMTGDKLPVGTQLSSGFTDSDLRYDDGANRMSIREEMPTKLKTSREMVSGQVTDEYGEPLPGVTVFLKGTSVGTVSDLDGNYTIDAGSGMTLNFSYLGMESADVRVGNRDTINIELESDVSALSEVVVFGEENVEESENADEVGFVVASPLVGLKEYGDYLRQSLIYPEEARLNQVEGKVILKLSLNELGEISKIEIKRSLGFGCDEEAIRLIKEGAGWSPAFVDGEPINTSVRVKVKFELED